MGRGYLVNMSHKQRVKTLQILVSTHMALKNSACLTAITGELKRIPGAARIPKHNGWLLMVLHTTRALDTCLRELLNHRGWKQPTRYNLGAYLTVLSRHHLLTHAEHQRFKSKIVAKRNRYMHEAGAMPARHEADNIVNEMHACLTQVLRRS